MKLKSLSRSIFHVTPILFTSAIALGITTQAATAVPEETSDTTPPALVTLSLESNSIDVTTGPQNLAFTIAFTDDLSGFSGASVGLNSPASGQEVNGWASILISGDELNGVVQGNINFPQYIEMGDWEISGLWLYDKAGNRVSFDTTTLSDSGFQTQVNVTSEEDLDPPVIEAISYSTTEVDVTDGPKDIVITVDISDQPAGVVFESYALQISSPLHSQTKYVGARDLVLINGDEQSGTWQATVSIPQYSEGGDWIVSAPSWLGGIKDSAGNKFDSPLDELGLENIITVSSSNPDTTPPQITGFDFTPKAINTSEGPVEISVTMQLEDDLSGVNFDPDTSSSSFVLGAAFQSPSAGQTARQPTFNGNTLLSGTELDGTWDAPINMRQYSEAGTWKMSYLRLKDKTNNVTTLRAEDLEALGLPTELIVIRPSLDGDGTLGVAGGTVTDETFGDRAQLTIPEGLLVEDAVISIDVFQDPLDVEIPTGFSAEGTRFVNVNFTPKPSFPVAEPGMTVVLPLIDARVPGSTLALFKLDTLTATLVPSISVYGGQVIGTVNADGISATFEGVAGFSTVVGLAENVEVIVGDLNGDECVDRSDYNLLKAALRSSDPAGQAYDLNGDEAVNIADLRTLIQLFSLPRGASCQPAA